MFFQFASDILCSTFLPILDWPFADLVPDVPVLSKDEKIILKARGLNVIFLGPTGQFTHVS